MSRPFRLVTLVVMTTAVIGLSGCGGGGGSVPYVVSPQPQPSTPVPAPSTNPPDITGVSPTSAVEGQSVTFSASATGGAATSWSWDFGGGATPNTSTSASPTVTIGSAGSYDASVTASNEDGSDTFTFPLTVNPGSIPPAPPGTVSWNPAEGGTWHITDIPFVPYRENSSLMSPKFSSDGVLSGASSYHNEDGDTVIAYERLENGEWVVEPAAVGDFVPYYSQMGFAFDSQGNPAISWGDYNDGAVHFAAKRDGEWHHEVVAPGGLFAPRTELFFDSQDRAVISFSYLTGSGGVSKIAREIPSGWEIIEPGAIPMWRCDPAATSFEPTARKTITSSGWQNGRAQSGNTSSSIKLPERNGQDPSP